MSCPLDFCTPPSFVSQRDNNNNIATSGSHFLRFPINQPTYNFLDSLPGIFVFFSIGFGIIYSHVFLVVFIGIRPTRKKNIPPKKKKMTAER
jgi:hypothetical protein